MKEEEIRPKAIFDEYLRLAEEDTRIFFEHAARHPIGCPACEAPGEWTFRKSGFDYRVCNVCQTLFVSPRPEAAAFARYYTESASSRYWATTFYKETADARKEKLWRPKASRIHALLQRMPRVSALPTIVDVGGGYGLFAELMTQEHQVSCTVIEPASHLATACREKGVTVIEKFLEEIEERDLPSGQRLFVSFELFEHLHDPAAFLTKLSNLMHADDWFLFTTLSGTGVDIQALWQESRSVAPPHHLNFLNPHAVRLLLNRVGMEPLEITTPGKLDIDILYNQQEQIQDRFLKTWIKMSSDPERTQMQEWLATAGWSSHMMVVCKKRQDPCESCQ